MSSTQCVYHVVATWDDEATVWVASSDDVPGLSTEADSIDALVEKLKVMIPELLEENGVSEAAEIPFELVSRCTVIAARHAA